MEKIIGIFSDTQSLTLKAKMPYSPDLSKVAKLLGISIWSWPEKIA